MALFLIVNAQRVIRDMFRKFKLIAIRTFRRLNRWWFKKRMHSQVVGNDDHTYNQVESESSISIAPPERTSTKYVSARLTNLEIIAEVPDL